MTKDRHFAASAQSGAGRPERPDGLHLAALLYGPPPPPVSLSNVRRITPQRPRLIVADVAFLLADGSALTVHGVIASQSGVSWPCGARQAPGESCVSFGSSSALEAAEALLTDAARRENNDPPAATRSGTLARERAA